MARAVLRGGSRDYGRSALLIRHSHMTSARDHRGALNSFAVIHFILADCVRKFIILNRKTGSSRGLGGAVIVKPLTPFTAVVLVQIRHRVQWA